MVNIDDLWHYNGPVKVLEGFHAHIPKGKLCGLMGPNGAGKSTLMKILAGIYPLLAGQVFIDGKALDQMSVQERSKTVAYIPQSHHINFAYQVVDVVAMGRYPHRDCAKDVIEIALEKTELTSLRHRCILELSGGELQRVFIARALVTQAKVLVMDEPFTFLDLRQTSRVSRILRTYTQEGGTILVSLHDVALALKLCDEVILMQSGKAFMHGLSSSILLDTHLSELYSLTLE